MKFSGKDFPDPGLANESESFQIATLSRICKIDRGTVKEFLSLLRKKEVALNEDGKPITLQEYWENFKENYKGDVYKICNDIEMIAGQHERPSSPRIARLEEKKAILQLKKEIRDICSPQDESYLDRYLNMYQKYYGIISTQNEVEKIRDEIDERRKSKEPLRRVCRYIRDKVL